MALKGKGRDVKTIKTQTGGPVCIHGRSHSQAGCGYNCGLHRTQAFGALVLPHEKEHEFTDPNQARFSICHRSLGSFVTLGAVAQKTDPPGLTPPGGGLTAARFFKPSPEGMRVCLVMIEREEGGERETLM